MSNLKHVRQKVGLTQSSLAASVALTQSAIAHYENGRRSPGLGECRRIVFALNLVGAKVSLDEVFPPESPPNLNQTIRPNPTADQSADDAGILYSAERATA
jgi:putative transcriptional regulator